MVWLFWNWLLGPFCWWFQIQALNYPHRGAHHNDKKWYIIYHISNLFQPLLVTRAHNTSLMFGKKRSSAVPWLKSFHGLLAAQPWATTSGVAPTARFGVKKDRTCIPVWFQVETDANQRYTVLYGKSLKNNYGSFMLYMSYVIHVNSDHLRPKNTNIKQFGSYWRGGSQMARPKERGLWAGVQEEMQQLPPAVKRGVTYGTCWRHGTDEFVGWLLTLGPRDLKLRHCKCIQRLNSNRCLSTVLSLFLGGYMHRLSWHHDNNNAIEKTKAKFAFWTPFFY